MDVVFLTDQQAAELLGVNTRTIRRWRLADPSFPAVRIGPGGRLVRTDRARLVEWLRTRETQRAEQPPERGRPRKAVVGS